MSSVRLVEKLQQAVEVVCLLRRDVASPGRPEVREVINRRSEGLHHLVRQSEGVALSFERLAFLLREKGVIPRPW